MGVRRIGALQCVAADGHCEPCGYIGAVYGSDDIGDARGYGSDDALAQYDAFTINVIGDIALGTLRQDLRDKVSRFSGRHMLTAELQYKLGGIGSH